MAIDILLPELGDGIESGDVLQVLVRVGDQIEKEQGLVELETDKATVEVPSSHAGKVAQIHVKEGQTIAVGAALVTIDQQAAATDSAPTPAAAAPATPEPPAPVPPASNPALPAQTSPAPPPPSAPVAPPAVAQSPLPANVAEDSSTAATGVAPLIAAGPAVRRLAREVGVDLASVTGTGSAGRVTRQDVLQVVRQASQALQQAGEQPVEPSTETDAWGPIRREKMSKIRRTIAAKMHESWTTVPRVTNFDDADVTEMERTRQASKADYAEKGIKLTSMPFVIKAVALALKNHPEVNASLDMEQGEITYKNYVNIGIAVDTPRGLVVPALRSADRLSVFDIASELAGIAQRVRDNKYTIDDLRGGTFTISNLGAIGGTYSTPIINVPEVAILLVGRSRKMPVAVEEGVGIRLMMPLSISYDHRLVDGAAAARFLNDVIGYLELPSRLLLAP